MVTEDKSHIYDSITLTDGKKLNLHTPVMNDMWPAFMQNKPLMEILVPAVTKLPWSWFLGLSILDGANVIKGCIPVMTHVQQIVTAFEEMRKSGETKH